MEFNTETEPLLNKQDDDIEEVFQKEITSKQKSIKQILDKSCSCNDLSENLFFCCCDYDLTNRQYELYIDLRSKLSIPYNQEDSNHEKILQDFFHNIKDLFPEDEEDLQNNNDIITISTNINNDDNNDKNDLIKNLSSKLGFQNNNPRTDFRAGGLCSLEFMNYFAIHHKLELKNMLKEKYFSFVLTSINLSFCFRLVLYLTNIINIDTTFKTYNLEGFSRRQIKHFSEQLENESQNMKSFFFSFLSQCLIFVFKKYQGEIEYDKKDENLVKINSINRFAISCFGDIINNIQKNENLEEKLRIKLANGIIGLK